MRVDTLLNKAHNKVDLKGYDLEDYRYVVIARHGFLSGWGEVRGKKAFALVLCKTAEMAMTVADNMKNPPHYFQYVRWEHLELLNPLPNKGRIYTLYVAEECHLWNK